MKKNILDSAEITNLWTHYTRETLAVCITKYALQSISDSEIRSILEFSLKLSNAHIQMLEGFFNKEDFPVPKGFTDDDVNLNAPPLFTDLFWLEYIKTMSTHGTTAYSLAYNSSTNKGLRKFYRQCSNDAMDINDLSVEILSSKGLCEQPPEYSKPNQIKYITKLNYVTDVFGKPRPLNTMECGNIYFNIKKSIVAKAIFLGFSQVCGEEEIQKYMEKSVQLANKHIGLFSSLLLQDNLRSPKLLDSEVTNSTVSPFSDKLMLFHVGFLISAGVSYYGTALVTSMRADIVAHCEASILRDLKFFAKFGQLMIKYNWPEQPPQADDRKNIERSP